MVIDKRLFIKEGLIQNNKFIIENSNVSLTITKNMNGSSLNNLFELVIIADDKIKPDIFLCDQIVYNPINYYLDILNSRSMLRPDQVIATHRIDRNENVSLYSFGDNEILMVINKEE